MPTNSEPERDCPPPTHNTYYTERFKRMDKNSDGQIRFVEEYLGLVEYTF